MYHITGAHRAVTAWLTGGRDGAGDRFSVAEEVAKLASSLYVVSPTLKVFFMTPHRCQTSPAFATHGRMWENQGAWS